MNTKIVFSLLLCGAFSLSLGTLGFAQSMPVDPSAPEINVENVASTMTEKKVKPMVKKGKLKGKKHLKGAHAHHKKMKKAHKAKMMKKAKMAEHEKMVAEQMNDVK